eukprot:CAMPEP_0116996856 /NCGR_PEP_ID=MMETSP0472-20121206/513_1 /TAXON_ID=693140 ORGANISM="Tiarina fusus, Strain LIS" /NCGR_SAMPLE_ID=MMETSP0472 /ASSEMBLY_ACC=CAM_ASM_000603 /LENGTH=142 /DNA_ID=CAMNT_0004695597 /DNA_START=37 /DNA_END=465 /DNA_ORIENTATION=+
MVKGVTLKDVAADKFVVAYAAHLKKAGQVVVPSWVGIQKTSSHRELSPYDPDWYYVRTAAIARQIYLHQGMGVGHLTIRYGGAQRRGVKPNRFHRGSTMVARTCLKSLEDLGLIEKNATGGRKITKAGQRELDTIAASVARS